MQQTVGEWGNNLAVRIPKEATFFKKGQKVTVEVREDMITVTPLKKRISMAERLANNDISTHPGILVDWGPDVGDEVVE